MNLGLNVLRIKYIDVKSVISDKVFCKGVKIWEKVLLGE